MNNKYIVCYTFILFFSFFFSTEINAKVDTVFNSEAICFYYNDCADAASRSELNNIALAKMAGILAILIFVTLYFFNKNKKIITLIIGGGLSLLIVLTTILPSNISKKKFESPCENLTSTACFKNDSSKPDEFVAVGSEFISSSGNVDEFSSNSNEFVSENKNRPDSFNTLKRSKNSFIFINNNEYRLLYEIIILFICVILVGLLIRYKWFRNIRGYFLIASIVYLGFVRGGCPCMIMSLQNFVLYLFGFDVSLVAMLWFLGLIPLTYFFGKVWCGWLCHLGAFQEILFLPEKIKILKSVKAQQWLRGIRIFFLVTLLIQIAITQTNYFVKIDPFKVAFNLFSSNITGYVLLVLLLATSVFIYRPFCRAVCPVGLILGWLAKIPHAQTITKEISCVNCVTCSAECMQHSMIHENKQTYLSEQDCILCGKCMGLCKKKSLNIKRRAIT